MARLRDHYITEVRKTLLDEFKYQNPMEVPRVTKIVLNMGVGEGVQDRKKVEAAAADMALIAGQRPVITRAKKSIAAFKLRREWRSVARLPCEESGCTSSSTG
jgi:large subunit ribosomal protein L5